MTPPSDLLEWVGRLRAPYGLERSVKIAPGALFDDRCLVSLHRNALGAAPAETLAEMARAMGMPIEFAARLPGALEGADFVHLGHEGGAGAPTRKIYFEYADCARRAMSRGESALVHLAYKWSPGRAAVTRYTWSPYRSRAEVEAKLRDLMPEAEAPRALGCALGLLARVAKLADCGQLLMMEVDEPGHPRRSCDLNVYDAELRVRDIADLIHAAARDFGVPDARLREVFGQSGGEALGHLSAGVGRDGAEFVTIYYGIQAH